MANAENRLVRYASYAAVAIAATLIILKLYAWVQTGSASILGSLLDSTVDIFASLVIMVAVLISQTPADQEHRFGHGKAEPLAAFAQSAFITGSAVYLIFYAIDHWVHDSELHKVNIGLWVMALSLVLTTLLVIFQTYVVYRTQSTAIKADALHYFSDILAMCLVIVGLWFSTLNWLDPVIAIVIALWILRSAYLIMKDSLRQLMDHELSEEMRQEIIDIVVSTSGVQGYNDMRSYQSGPNYFVQLDLEIEDSLSVFEGHEIAEKVTKNLKARFPSLDVMIHQEPVSCRDDDQHHSWGVK